ncbi:MAG: AsmA family protein, partial [Pseudomonadota bacterium]
ALPSFLQSEQLTSRAQEAASDALGRKVRIGDVRNLSILPPRLSVSGFEVANAEGFDDPFLLNVSEAHFAVSLMPLLSGRVDIQTFVLEAPTIFLEEKADGRTNYAFETEAPPQENGEPIEIAEDPDAAADLGKVSGTLRINNGTLTYRTPDATYVAEETNMTVVLPGADGPLTFDGSLALDGIPVTMDVAIDKPTVLAEGGTTTGRFDLQFADNTINSTLSLTGEPVRLRGDVAGDLSDLASMTPILGAETVASLAPLGAIQFDGSLEGTTERLAVNGASFITAVASGQADLDLNLSEDLPKAAGSANLSVLDLRPFLSEDAVQADNASTRASSAEEAFPEWSDDAMDFSALSTLNADLAVSAERIILPTYELTNVASNVTIEGSRLTARLTDAQVFSGTATGEVLVDAARQTPTLGLDFTMANVSFAEAGPALLGTERLIGGGDINLALKTSGLSQRAWVRGLNGTVGADIANGEILGIDLAEIANTGLTLVDNVRSGTSVPQSLLSAAGNLATNAVRPSAKTSFDLADFGIAVRNGVATIGNAQIVSDTLRARIGGNVSLLPQTVDMDIALAGKLPEETGYKEMPLPVSIGGSFNDPKVSVDTKPLIRSAARDAASDLLDDVGIDLREDQSVGDALRESAEGEVNRFFGRLIKDDKDKKK